MELCGRCYLRDDCEIRVALSDGRADVVLHELRRQGHFGDIANVSGNMTWLFVCHAAVVSVATKNNTPALEWLLLGVLCRAAPVWYDRTMDRWIGDQ